MNRVGMTIRGRPRRRGSSGIADVARSLPAWTGPVVAAAGAVGLYWISRKMREMNLRDRVVVITGGSRGLGLLMAREFGRLGARLAICARTTEDLQRARTMLESQGVETLAVTCDVGDREQVEEFVSKVRHYYGRIDVLVNNAGIIQVGPLESMTEKDFAAALNVMFWGMLHATLAVLPHMRSRGSGRIVNITSLGGKVSLPHMLPYNCAKFAAVGLSQGLRSELRSSGIKVTTVVPGTMRIGSHLRAEFRSREMKEYTWFSLASSTPLLSLSGRRAARQIVKAAQRGDALRVLGLPANILERLNALFPGLMTDVMGLVARVMPSGNRAGNSGARGIDLDAKMRSRLIYRLTTLGRRAARLNNEVGDSQGA